MFGSVGKSGGKGGFMKGIIAGAESFKNRVEGRGMAKFEQLKTDFEVPELLQSDIDALQEGVENDVLYVDCLQDEVRSSAHGCTDAGLTEEQAEEIIDYYCRRRW